MKKSIDKLFVVIFSVVVLVLGSTSLAAFSLSENEVKLLNLISPCYDKKPEGQSLRPVEMAMKSRNPVLQGMAALILFRHYGKDFRARFLRSFTLNSAVEKFAVSKKVLVKIENVDRLLASYAGLLERLSDERTRQLFLFYYFRHKQVYLLGAANEQLSLAAFYRVSLFEQVLGKRYDAVSLAAAADR